MIDLSKKFCGRPWEFLEIVDGGGKLKVFNCCPSWVNYNDIGAVDYNFDFDSTWNGEKSRDFRRSVLDGSFKFCNTGICPIIQNNSLPARNDILQGKCGEYYKNILEMNLVLANNPNFINLCYDVSCNLKCPSCRPTFSFLNEKTNLSEYNLKKQFQKILLEYLYKCVDRLTVSITGSGDPFASKLFWDFLQSIDGRLNPNIGINLQTNGILFNELNWKKLNKLHDNKITTLISLDAGTKETYSIVRRGGDWDVLMNNLKFISSLYNENKLAGVRLDCVVQNNNYTELDKFIAIAKQYNFNCYLSRILKVSYWSDEEFKQHNIFDVSHKNHIDFLQIIRKNFEYNRIDFGNLSEYRTI